MNNWQLFLKDYRSKHPNLSFKEALSKASKEYRCKNTSGAGIGSSKPKKYAVENTADLGPLKKLQKEKKRLARLARWVEDPLDGLIYRAEHAKVKTDIKRMDDELRPMLTRGHLANETNLPSSVIDNLVLPYAGITGSGCRARVEFEHRPDWFIKPYVTRHVMGSGNCCSDPFYDPESRSSQMDNSSQRPQLAKKEKTYKDPDDVVKPERPNSLTMRKNKALQGLSRLVNGYLQYEDDYDLDYNTTVYDDIEPLPPTYGTGSMFSRRNRVTRINIPNNIDTNVANRAMNRVHEEFETNFPHETVNRNTYPLALDPRAAIIQRNGNHAIVRVQLLNGDTVVVDRNVSEDYTDSEMEHIYGDFITSETRTRDEEKDEFSQ